MVQHSCSSWFPPPHERRWLVWVVVSVLLVVVDLRVAATTTTTTTTTIQDSTLGTHTTATTSSSSLSRGTTVPVTNELPQRQQRPLERQLETQNDEFVAGQGSVFQPCRTTTRQVLLSLDPNFGGVIVPSTHDARRLQHPLPPNNHNHHKALSWQRHPLRMGLRGGGGQQDNDDMTQQDATTSTLSSSVSPQAVAQARAVQDILARRLEHVHKGHRGKRVAAWMQRQNKHKQPSVVSAHGVAVPQPSVDDTEQVESPPTTHSPNKKSNDPFPANRGQLHLEDLPFSSNFTQQFHKERQTGSLQPPSVWQLACRAVTLTWRFFPAWSTVGLAYWCPPFRRQCWYPWVTQCLAHSGAAFIKWGQWTSTRNDMFPDVFCQALSQLHNEAPAHDWKRSQSELEQALQLAPNTLPLVFDVVDPQPLASGSIAQVHRAVLNQEWVALKIRHPRVAELLQLDFCLMAVTATWVDRLVPGLRWLRLRESVDQFSSTMAAQADLHVEAHHLELLNTNFAAWPQVNFPHPIFASDAVIIETFEAGRIVTSVLKEYQVQAQQLQQRATAHHKRQRPRFWPWSRRPTIVQVDDHHPDDPDAYTVQEPNDSTPEWTAAMAHAAAHVQGHELVPLEVARFIVTTGVGIYLKMLLVHNLMHADLHPGTYKETQSISTTVDACLSLCVVTLLLLLFFMIIRQHHVGFVSSQSPNQQGVEQNGRGRRGSTSSETTTTHQEWHDGNLGRCRNGGPIDGRRRFRLYWTLVVFGIGKWSRSGTVCPLVFPRKSPRDFSRRPTSLYRRHATPLSTHLSGIWYQCRCRRSPSRSVGYVCVCVTIAGDSCVWSFSRRPLFGSLRLRSRFSFSLSPGLIRKYQIRIDANYATLVVNVLCIESLARQTFPTYNVLDAARPLLESYRRLCYTHTGVPKPNARRSRWVQLWLSVMYWKKALWDRHFFRTEAARRRRKLEGFWDNGPELTQKLVGNVQVFQFPALCFRLEPTSCSDRGLCSCSKIALGVDRVIESGIQPGCVRFVFSIYSRNPIIPKDT